MPYGNSEGPHQYVQPCSLIRAFVTHLQNHLIIKNKSMDMEGPEQAWWMCRLILTLLSTCGIRALFLHSIL